jgi:hypothetical protein
MAQVEIVTGLCCQHVACRLLHLTMMVKINCSQNYQTWLGDCREVQLTAYPNIADKGFRVREPQTGMHEITRVVVVAASPPAPPLPLQAHDPPSHEPFTQTPVVDSRASLFVIGHATSERGTCVSHWPVAGVHEISLQGSVELHVAPAHGSDAQHSIEAAGQAGLMAHCFGGFCHSVTMMILKNRSHWSCGKVKIVPHRLQALPYSVQGFQLVTILRPQCIATLTKLEVACV